MQHPSTLSPLHPNRRPLWERCEGSTLEASHCCEDALILGLEPLVVSPVPLSSSCLIWTDVGAGTTTPPPFQTMILLPRSLPTIFYYSISQNFRLLRVESRMQFSCYSGLIYFFLQEVEGIVGV